MKHGSFPVISFFFCVSLLVTGCAGEEQSGSDDRVEEIEAGGIAELIRNPISAENPADTADMARIRFEDTVFDFDTIAEGEVVEHRFRFRNTGKTPLVVNNARSTCGCTVPEWPKDPIPPGEGGEILVRFNSTDKKGAQNKPITIFANSYPQQTVVYMRGFVTN